MIILECDCCRARRPAREEDFGTVPRCDRCLISMSEVDPVTNQVDPTIQPRWSSHGQAPQTTRQD